MNSDAEVSLRKPPGDQAGQVDVTLLVPAMNEAVTIGEFVDWCWEGLHRLQATGEVLIVDSSQDGTAEIALAHGARVLCTPPRGLGRAYIDAIPHARGRWVIMGDADLTYDFRELGPFVEAFKRGAEYVMGSRFRGTIEAGAMPMLHRWFGTPVTTWMMNLIFGSHFTDIHCGMRGATREALIRMRLRSQSWQYASEMIIKAVQLRLRIDEVPVIFHKDREGRVSHLKRIGWTAPWHAGWLTVKALFTYGADFFLLKPGVIMLAAGSVGVAGLSLGPRTLGPIGFSLHWMLAFVVLFLCGLNFAQLGILARVLYDHEQNRSSRWQRLFNLDRAIPLAGITALIGVVATLPLVSEYWQSGLRLPPELGPASYTGVAGMALVLAAFSHATFALLFSAVISLLPDARASNAA